MGRPCFAAVPVSYTHLEVYKRQGLYEAVSRLILQTNGLSLITVLSYASMAGNIVLVFCGVGLVIGVGGSVVAIRKFLQV